MSHDTIKEDREARRNHLLDEINDVKHVDSVNDNSAKIRYGLGIIAEAILMLDSTVMTLVDHLKKQKKHKDKD